MDAIGRRLSTSWDCKKIPHIAFKVSVIDEAIKGRNVIIEPNKPSAGVLTAFIEDNGAPVELIQILELNTKLIYFLILFW